MVACEACGQPLVINLDDGPEVQSNENEQVGNTSGEPDIVPDDLELTCGCHFHWQCLLDESSEIAMSLQCPNCERFLATNTAGPSVTNTLLRTTEGATIMTTYTNEGGTQQNLDILPAITEEAYLESHPEARPARAMHVMCAEGDISGIVDLLRDLHQQGEDVASLICYQDPLSAMKSGIHLAIEHEQEEVVWLLLWLSSALPQASFPDQARQAADSMELGRLSATPGLDVRRLRDSNGRTAEDFAREHQTYWQALLDNGILSV